MPEPTRGRWLLPAGATALLAVAFALTWALAPRARTSGAGEGGVTRVLTIQGMTCERCEGHVRKELERLDGVDVVSVSAVAGEATIRARPDAVSEDACREAVFQAGYILKEMRDPASP